MKILKEEFKTKLTKCSSLSALIQKVVFPFIQQILSNRLEVYLSVQSEFEGHQLLADWSKFELVLFNIF